MKALILGCSHAAGAEMYQDTSITIDNPGSFGWLNSYPVSVARRLGYEPMNYAISGGSNDAMFRIFIEQLKNLTTNDVVIACWTGCSRTELWHDIDKCWLPMSMGRQHWTRYKSSTYALSGDNDGGKISFEEEYLAYADEWNKFHLNQQASNQNKLKNILALNALATQHGIRVININSFHPVEYTDRVNWAIDTDFCAWCETNKYPHTDWGHYFLAAHQAFADQVVAWLQVNCKP
jgi:hypothetical protein